ncbi:MAG TPA: hypothetical protein PKK12_10145 [Candidatus Aminicenantes bacterium]|nr:hypothetical protein [Candidatus Aminicenantes bacterium]
MSRSMVRLAIGALIALLLLTAGCSGGKRKGSARQGSFLQMARERADQAKIQALKAAVAAYTVEHDDQPPRTLGELVEKGYVPPEAIVGADGKPLSLDPAELAGDLAATATTVSKSCGRCGKSVSSTAQAGDRCPHCGVVWDVERQI